ncbi:MAG: hypothetical protein ACLFS8_02585 [Clostridia bacterium]
MSDEVQTENGVFENEFIPFITRWGMITNLTAALVSFGPVLVLATVYGLVPSSGAIVAGFVSILSVSGAFWIVEPISYFPVLGIPGTYIAFLSGNISNLRLPCAAIAQEAADVEPGTDEGAIISTLGVAASVLVNVVILTIGVILGAAVIERLSPEIREAFDYILPAIFGAIFVQFALTEIKVGIVALVIGGFTTWLMQAGYLAFLPGTPSYAVIIVSVFGTILVARWMFERGMLDSS